MFDQKVRRKRFVPPGRTRSEIVRRSQVRELAPRNRGRAVSNWTIFRALTRKIIGKLSTFLNNQLNTVYRKKKRRSGWHQSELQSNDLRSLMKQHRKRILYRRRLLLGAFSIFALYCVALGIQTVVRSVVSLELPKTEATLTPTNYQSKGDRWWVGRSFRPQVPVKALFLDLKSPGVIAVCAAEGNCETDGTYTSLIEGHLDPATGLLNKGFCSNHGRGGTLKEANKWCLRRLRSQSFAIDQEFKDVGVNPEYHLEGFINAIDLWNQSPYFGDKFPRLYATALRQEKEGEEAILWARVETFKKEGSYEETTLAHPPICPYDMKPKSCIEADQSRRMDAIAAVLQKLGLK